MATKIQFCRNGHDTFLVGRSQGLCRICKKERDRINQAILRKKRIDLQICVVCGKIPLVTKRLCSNCTKFSKNWRDSDKKFVMDHYGAECACCKENNLVFLTIDHIAGNGAKRRKIEGNHVYRYLINNNFPSGYQVLCFNCNCAKRTQEHCPHQLLVRS